MEDRDRHSMAKHLAYIYYEDSSWDEVKDFLLSTGFSEDKANAFLDENRDLILRYRGKLVDWFEGGMIGLVGKRL